MERQLGLQPYTGQKDRFSLVDTCQLSNSCDLRVRL